MCQQFKEEGSVCSFFRAVGKTKSWNMFGSKSRLRGKDRAEETRGSEIYFGGERSGQTKLRGTNFNMRDVRNLLIVPSEKADTGESERRHIKGGPIASTTI